MNLQQDNREEITFWMFAVIMAVLCVGGFVLGICHGKQIGKWEVCAEAAKRDIILTEVCK